MPGYPPLNSSISGAAAESARAAESLHRGGAPAQAALLLEEALAASLALSPVLPGWLCGRLASLYRTLGRLDDEVHLLERYRDSQVDDDARTRYEARLSKARTLAVRRRRPESGALSSIREAVRAPRRARAAASEPATAPESPALVSASLAELFGAPTQEAFSARLDAVLGEYVAESRARQLPLDVVVDGLRAASGSSSEGTGQPLRYSAALVRLLALYYTEAGSAA